MTTANRRLRVRTARRRSLRNFAISLIFTEFFAELAVRLFSLNSSSRTPNLTPHLVQTTNGTRILRSNLDSVRWPDAKSRSRRIGSMSRASPEMSVRLTVSRFLCSVSQLADRLDAESKFYRQLKKDRAAALVEVDRAPAEKKGRMGRVPKGKEMTVDDLVVTKVRMVKNLPVDVTTKFVVVFGSDSGFTLILALSVAMRNRTLEFRLRRTRSTAFRSSNRFSTNFSISNLPRFQVVSPSSTGIRVESADRCRYAATLASIPRLRQQSSPYRSFGSICTFPFRFADDSVACLCYVETTTHFAS